MKINKTNKQTKATVADPIETTTGGLTELIKSH